MDPSSTLAGPFALASLAASVLGFAAWWRPSSAWLRLVSIAAGLACAAAGVALWVLRWWSAGHLPLFGTYESALSLAAAVLLASLAAWIRRPASPGVWPVACGVSTVLVAHGLRFDPTVFALTISERSWVVDVHAFLAWSAFGTLAVNAGFALRRLLPGAATPSGGDGRLAFTLSLGFLLHSAMMASGSFYKFLLFGRAWSFDPIETLGFVAWVSYGTLLHMHLFSGWRDRRLARWCLGLFVLLVVSYRGIVYFPAWSTYHIFDMDLRIHLTGSEPPEAGGTD